MTHRIPAVLALVIVLLTGCGKSAPDASNAGAAAPAASVAPAAANPAAQATGTTAVIEMPQGNIEIELLAKDAPRAVENFRLLAERGFYNNLTFHRIVKGFMIQGGDPMGNGMGGESAWGGPFPDEINRASPLYRAGYKRGLVAMANSGPNSNTSQFFIMHQDYGLPPNYVIFGRVTKGMEVVDAIANTATTMGNDGGMSRPTTPVVMKKVSVK